VEIGNEAAQFLFREYINPNFFAVRAPYNPVLKPIHRPLFTDHSYTEELVFDLSIGDHFFLNMNSALHYSKTKIAVRMAPSRSGSFLKFGSQPLATRTRVAAIKKLSGRMARQGSN
jgi:hypothetical protein